MNPLWALFFKDRFKTPLSIYKMSLAEIIILLSMLVGFGFALWEGLQWIVEFEAAAGITE